MADALWRKKDRELQFAGFPLAINLSFGMQAGPKDGALPFETQFEGLVRGRITGGGVDPNPPIRRLSMPAGNGDLMRGTARLELERDRIAWLDWRIKP